MLYLTIMLIGIDPAMFCLARPSSNELQYSAALVEKCAKDGKTLVVQKGQIAKKEVGKVYCVSTLDVIPNGITEYVPNSTKNWMVEKPKQAALKTSQRMIQVCGPNGCSLVPESQYQFSVPFYGGCTSCGR